MTRDRGTNPKSFLSGPESDQVVQAIQKAERGTTGEIRVRIDRQCGRPALLAAELLFHRLKMDATAQRNGVLIYLSLADRQFAVYGDRGIDATIGADGWSRIRDRLAARFAKDEFAVGLAEAVADIGRVLSKQFPGQKNDPNELSDDLSLGR